MALCGQVIDLVRLHLLNDPNQVRRIRQISVVQLETNVFLVRILVQVIDAIGIE
jgi:hypothetical protein